MGNISNNTTTSTTAQSVHDMEPAIRFHPTEKQMADFLWKKMKGHNSQACHSIPVIDVCKFEPWDLPERMFPDARHQAEAWYSFSQPDYKYVNSPRCNRITEKGFWKITGKPQDISSTHVTCKKRILTFYKGRVLKSERTGWVMHEYYFTKPKQGSNTSQERDPLRAFVLYRLKKKPNSTDQVICDMIQQYKPCAPVGEYLNSLSILPEPPQPHQPPQLGNAPHVCSDELVDPSTGGCITGNTDNQDYSLPEENRGSPVQPFDQLQNYPLQSSIFSSELGQLMLANTYIGRNESCTL